MVDLRFPGYRVDAGGAGLQPRRRRPARRAGPALGRAPLARILQPDMEGTESIENKDGALARHSVVGLLARVRTGAGGEREAWWPITVQACWLRGHGSILPACATRGPRRSQ